MGIVLKVTPETLVSMSSDIEKKISDLQKLFQEIHTDISRTRSFWEGEAGDQHRTQYEDMKGDIDETIKRLKDRPVSLLQMANLYKETEVKVTGAAQMLQADVIV